MDFIEFVDIVTNIKTKKKILFELASDKIASDEELSKIENYYQLELPKDYKNFLQIYGGGYFAYVVVYSCDFNSDFYLINNVTRDWINNHEFFPVIDFETGDLGGFKIYNNICDNSISIFNHDADKVTMNSNIDFCEFLIKYGLKL